MAVAISQFCEAATAFFVCANSEVIKIGMYIKSPISWVGGKGALRDVILMSFPLIVDRYIEVFGGGATILLSKQPSKFEVYNDFNSDLVNMFRCIKEKPLSFFRYAGCFPLNSRLEFQMLLDFINCREPDFSNINKEIQVAQEQFNEEDSRELIEALSGKAKMYDVERAAAFYKLIRYSYGSAGKNFGGQPVNLARTLENIYAVANRLSNVVIENKDFESLIKQYDRPNSFFYLDPPYVETEGHYMVDFPREDHFRLYECLKNIKGKFLLSYNDCELIKELYKDYVIVERSRLNSLAQRYSAGSEFRELLIANFDINERRKNVPVQLSLFGVDDDYYERDYLQDYRSKRANNHTFYIPYALRDRG